MSNVIGVGGVFFLCRDPDATKAWYRDVLGLEESEHGGFAFAHSKSAARFPKGAMTIFSPFKAESDYFKPSEQTVMFNLMIDDLAAVVTRIKAAGGELAQPQEDHDYGKFAWIMDPDGRKVELWEPVEPAAD